LSQLPEELAARRQWFERYFADTTVELLAAHGLRRRHTCPCCGYPTLLHRSYYEICKLCGWEDDGQDDPSADEWWGGPNYQYSLTLARENFARYGSKYNPGGDQRLFPDSAVVVHAKRAITKAFDLMSRQTSLDTQFALWAIIGENEEILRHELDRRVENYSAFDQVVHSHDHPHHPLSGLDSDA
jgi:hypothetical protein